MRVLLTGATGFVGSGLLDRLQRLPELRLRVAIRSRAASFSPAVEVFRIDGLSALQDWADALHEVDVVIHAAARVHVMHEKLADPISEFRAVNVDATLNLARQAAAAGVKRFIFISSIKVNGEESAAGAPFTADSRLSPLDPYGQSKLEAEQGLLDIAGETGLEVVIIRPPLVYGPGVRANFASLMRALDRRLPLPFALVDNRRSLVSRANLVDLILLCMKHPAAANQVFLVSDGRDLSTAELCRKLSHALEVRPRLLPVPQGLLRFLAALLGKRAQMQRLLGSLQLDIGKTERLLGWTPPVSVDDALRETARWHREHGQG
ncbi:UDP-glucose 4-epimerase family protein [Pseudomonas schmalbachii]|uniref:SDR family oxidoreductase n=1 Tax=Pseudomonas schmalbachii TaxID=2816993 RepID=A0ABS3TPE8_9PSED|nr:SDR family oxidoreductase [Pseudomonas schmalbachii]MBO3274575.1 SDR family oxidoreductase [Pseudomonas schmalbachii]